MKQLWLQDAKNASSASCVALRDAHAPQITPMEGTIPGCRACQQSVPPRCPVTKPSRQNAVAVASSWWLNQPI